MFPLRLIFQFLACLIFVLQISHSFGNELCGEMPPKQILDKTEDRLNAEAHGVFEVIRK